MMMTTANTPTSATFHPFRQQIMEVPTYLEQKEYISFFTANSENSFKIKV
jgi:hypothetical protein